MEILLTPTLIGLLLGWLTLAAGFILFTYTRRWWHTNRYGRPIDHSTLLTLIQKFPDYQLKFVIDDSDDMHEVLEILNAVGGVDPWKVLLMAQGRTPEEVAARAPEVAALCLEHGFRYTPRLHLDLFGGGRGV